MTKMTDIELAIRTVEEVIPHMSTEDLQKWQGILNTAVVKIEKELVAVCQHTCEICFAQEYGYRNELPIAWHSTAGIKSCFKHEYDEVKKIAEELEEAQPFSEEPKKSTLEELMALI